MVAVTKKLGKKQKSEAKPEVKHEAKEKVKGTSNPIKLKTIMKKKDKVSKLNLVPKLTRDSAKSKKKQLDPEALSEYLVLRNVPFGFFEEEAYKYCSQYGDVEKVVAMRNKKGGFSGKIFVGFKYPEVAAVVETVLHKSIMLTENVINCMHLKNKDVPVYVRYAMKNVTFDKNVIVPTKPSKPELLKKRLQRAYSAIHVEKPEKVAEYINKQLVKAKELGYDYKFDFSSKLEQAMKQNKKDLKAVNTKIKTWLNKPAVKEVAEKLKMKKDLKAVNTKIKTWLNKPAVQEVAEKLKMKV
uniref:RRM domain-containing protein n=1 Tax=Panagrolaimus sp. JU765 TaxID=591449 RepID=A0AC34R3C9_9BILA